MLRKIMTIAAFATGLTGLAATAGAMPVGSGASAPDITLVAGGCGPGWHRGPYGGCRPNVGPRFMAPRVMAPRCVFRRDRWGRPIRICR